MLGGRTPAACLQDWQKKHELDRKSIAELVCALCDTRQPVSTACTACGVQFGERRRRAAGGAAGVAGGQQSPASSDACCVLPTTALCTARRRVAASASAAAAATAGAYSCLTCRFFDDDLAKQPYHCDQCGICRWVGAGVGAWVRGLLEG